jgi:hypothetical protein
MPSYFSIKEKKYRAQKEHWNSIGDEMKQASMN